MPDALEPKPQDTSQPEEVPSVISERFPELEKLQQEVQKRIRDNRRFLEGFLSEDFLEGIDEEEDEEEEGEENT